MPGSTASKTLKSGQGAMVMGMHAAQACVFVQGVHMNLTEVFINLVIMRRSARHSTT